MAKQFNRWDLLPAANKGIRAASVSTNRRASDRYHRGTSLKNLNPLSGGGKSKGIGRNRVVRLIRRSNNGNMPGHGVGGVPGNGLGGGIPSFGLKHILKNHHALQGQNTYKAPMIGGAGVNAPKLKANPPFKPVKPLPVRKIPKPLATKQPKPMTSTRLGPLGSAKTTRPNFAAKGK